MTRIAGIELNDKARISYALTTFKGIGWSLSKKILDSLKIDHSKRVSELSQKDIAKIIGVLDEQIIEGELIRKVRNDMARLKSISSYRGLRHLRSLPVRGQRTRSNARTKRGKRKTVGAFRKEALGKMQQQKAKKEA